MAAARSGKDGTKPSAARARKPKAATGIELAKDIAVLQAFRRCRHDFNMRLAEQSADPSEAVLDALRTDATYQLAEFFFLLKGFAIRTPAEFDGLLERHNSYVTQLLTDPGKMARMGLSKDRLLGAIFDGETRPRVLKIWTDDPGTIDQSTLARLLVAVMSDETARKTIVACSKAGFLERHTSVFRLVLVKSNDRLETIYGDCLRQVREAVQGLG